MFGDPQSKGAAHLGADSSESGAGSATRGVEALREETTRTAPPSSLGDAAMTELPSSLSGLGGAQEQEDAAQLTAPRTLLDLTLSSLLVVPADVPWSRHPSGLVCATADAQAPFYYDTRAFVARARVAETAPASAASNKGFTKIDGGRVVLGPRSDDEKLHLLDLAGESLIVHDRYVVAFAAADGDVPTRHPSPWPLEMLQFSGAGAVVLGLPDAVLAYDVRIGDEFELRASNLIGWAGELTALVDTELARAGRRVRFVGNGTVLLLTRPHGISSPMIPRAAGAR